MSRFNDFVLLSYEEYEKFNQDVLDLKISELECKHILCENTDNQFFVELAKKVQYQWVVFGSHRGLKEEERIQFEINRINDMASSDFCRPVRIVKTDNGKLFADNTHWVLAYLKRFGDNIKLKDIPFYLVDFCHKIPLIVDFNNSVIKNYEDIKNAVNAAGEIEERIEKGWRDDNISYTIQEFCDEICEFEEKSIENVFICKST